MRCSTVATTGIDGGSVIKPSGSEGAVPSPTESRNEAKSVFSGVVDEWRRRKFFVRVRWMKWGNRLDDKKDALT